MRIATGSDQSFVATRRRRLALVAVSFAIVGIWVARPCGGAQRATTSARTAASAAAGAASGRGARASRIRELPTPSRVSRPGEQDTRPDLITETVGTDVRDPESQRLAIQQLDRTVDLYRETMRLPLWSRPADSATASLEAWNEGARAGQPFAADADKREIRVDAFLDRGFVLPGEALAVAITCAFSDGQPVMPDMVDAQLEVLDLESGTWVAVTEIPLHRVATGVAGSLIPTTLVALQGPLREVRIAAYVRIGDFDKQLALPFAYAASLPVVVRGVARDRVVEGSLQVDLDVEASATGSVFLAATLYSGDGKRALATYEDFHSVARTGRQVISIRFFGKILHGAGIDGPYRLGAVHGFVYDRDAAPRERRFIRADVPALMTDTYRALDFSADDFTSPEVESALSRYESLRGELGGTPTP